MLTAPSPSTGLAGWFLLGLIWLGVALLLWDLSRPVRRRVFPPRRCGEYVRIDELGPPTSTRRRRVDPSPRPRSHTHA